MLNIGLGLIGIHGCGVLHAKCGDMAANMARYDMLFVEAIRLHYVY